MIFKIKTLNNISVKGLSHFPTDLYQIANNVTDPDAILVRSADMHNITIPKSVLMIGRAGVGVNNIPIDELTQRGIPVFNTPGANANAVRELVIACMLMASRNICQAWNFVNRLELSGDELTREVEQSKNQFIGTELAGKTLGIIGLGNVGVKVANAAIALGMRIIGFDNSIHVDRAWELSSHVERARSLHYLFNEADFISVHVPLTDATDKIINADAIKAMKSGVVMLNFSRDEIVDDKALLAALNEKKIAAYVSDFPKSELKNHPNVLYLPHIGASTKEAEENCAVMIVKQTREFLENGNITNSINFPTLEIPLIQNTIRVAIANKNIPNMVAQITSLLGAANINIASLANTSKNDIAYTIVDINQDMDNILLQQMENIDGVLHVRKIRNINPQ